MGEECESNIQITDFFKIVLTLFIKIYMIHFKLADTVESVGLVTTYMCQHWEVLIRHTANGSRLFMLMVNTSCIQTNAIYISR